MKFIFAFGYFFILLNILSAQYQLATYDAEIKTISGPAYSGEVKLLFDRDEALFYHPYWPEQSSYQRMESGTLFTPGDSEGMPVYTNLGKATQTFKIAYGVSKGPLFIFEEKIPVINWVISNETRQLGKFKVQLATGSYAGRDYEAWFAPELAVPFGPYRFGGLPGLILSLESRDGLVNYRIKSLSSTTASFVRSLAPPTEGRMLNESEFEQYIIRKLLRAESLSSAEFTITNNDPPADYEIEKSRWTIISAYKKQRGY